MSAPWAAVRRAVRRSRPAVMVGVLCAGGVVQLADGHPYPGATLLGAALYVAAVEWQRVAAYRRGYRRGLITAADAAAELYAGRAAVGELPIPAPYDVDPDDGWHDTEPPVVRRHGEQRG